jgi:hypothetical protein
MKISNSVFFFNNINVPYSTKTCCFGAGRPLYKYSGTNAYLITHSEIVSYQIPILTITVIQNVRIQAGSSECIEQTILKGQRSAKKSISLKTVENFRLENKLRKTLCKI